VTKKSEVEERISREEAAWNVLRVSHHVGMAHSHLNDPGGDAFACRAHLNEARKMIQALLNQLPEWQVVDVAPNPE